MNPMIAYEKQLRKDVVRLCLALELGAERGVYDRIAKTAAAEDLMQLRKVIPPEESNDFCHRMVLHGRAVCMARSPQCGLCTLASVCKYGKSVLK